MAIDSFLPVRRAIIAELKGDTPLSALIGDRFYPQAPPANPTWPFGKYGAPSSIPVRASCVDGSEMRVSLHGFSKGRRSGNRLIESAEDHAARIGAAMAGAVDGRRLTIPGGYALVQWRGSQLMMDGAEADAFHCVVGLRVRCMTV